MRLTDADALKQTFCAECDHSIKCEDCDIDYHFEHLAPTVDAVEAVRCKDCKWASACYGDIVRASKGGGEVHMPLGTDGYCSLAERKEDETH